MRRLLPACLSFLLIGGCLTNTDEAKPTLGKDSSVLNLARSSREAGDSKAAISLLMQQVANKTNNPSIYATLAEMLQEQGKLRQAIEVLEKGNQVIPGDALIHRKLGNAYLLDNQPQKAEVVFNQGLEKNKDDSRLLGSKGVALDLQGKTEPAREAYQAAIKADSDNVSAANNLAMSHLLAGETDQAVAVLESASEKTTATPQIRQNLAFAYVLKGEDDKALKIGLQDYSEKDMEKNIAYYHSVSDAVKTGKVAAAKVMPVEVKDSPLVSVSPGPGSKKVPLAISTGKKIPLVAEDDAEEELLKSAVPSAGSVSTEAKASATDKGAADKFAAKKWYIDLGEFPSIDAARKQWDTLRAKVADLPDDAFGTHRQADGKERLVMGPYAGFGDFKGTCDALKKAKVACNVVQISK